MHRAMEAPVDNRTLLDKIRSGDPGAFEDLVRAYGDSVYGFGIRMCGEREDAKDVLQDTLLQAFRKLRTLKHPEALKSWIFRVAANACLMKRRRGKYAPDREVSLDELAPRDAADAEAEIPDTAELPDASLEREEIRAEVRAAIEEIPPHYRVVLLLRDMEHLSSREVSEVLDLPETAVKMRLHRARLMVRRALERRAGGDAAREGRG